MKYWIVGMLLVVGCDMPPPQREPCRDRVLPWRSDFGRDEKDGCWDDRQQMVRMPGDRINWMCACPGSPNLPRPQ